MNSGYKNVLYLSLLVTIFPILLFFLFRYCINDLMLLFSGTGVVYYNWRVIPILSSAPFMIYLELLFISCFFTEDKKASPLLLKYMLHMTIIYCFVFFSSLIACPLINIGFAFSSYHACPSGGAFSGVYYVKDKSKCFEITGIAPWGDGDGYKGNKFPE